LARRKLLPVIDIGKVADDNLEYIDNRRKGLITSLKSKFTRLDKYLMGGFEDCTITTLAAMSGAGKSTLAKTITDSFFEYNKDKEFVIVYLNFEMVSHHMMSRSAVSKRKIKLQDLYSVDEALSDEEFEQIKQYYSLLKKRNAKFIEVTGTATQIYNTLLKLWGENRDKTLVYILDHSLLTKPEQNESEKDRIDSLMNKLLEFKKVVVAHGGSSIGFVLSQLNRAIYSSERVQNKDQHRPKTDCLFGASSVEQISDYIIVNHIPAKLGIKSYTPSDLPTVVTVVEDGEERDMKMAYFEILKNRSGAPDITIPMWNRLEYFDFDEMEVDVFNDLCKQFEQNGECKYEEGKQRTMFTV
jgi:replicative DNA helicase